MNAHALLRAVVKREQAGALTASFDTAFTLASIDAGDIGRYNDLLGFGEGEVPVTYYYLIAQRAHLGSLLGEQFPFRAAGMVHVENQIVEHAAPALETALDVFTTVSIEPASENGARYCALETVATQGGHKIFTCHSRYLARRGQRKAPSERSPEGHPYLPAGGWSLSPSSGREYAAVSGDWNPIHLWAWSARMMGMNSPIIHGMHTVAKACAAIQSTTGRHVSAVSARFKAPIQLGSDVTLTASGDWTSFDAVCDGRIAVQGTLSFAKEPAA